MKPSSAMALVSRGVRSAASTLVNANTQTSAVASRFGMRVVFIRWFELVSFHNRSNELFPCVPGFLVINTSDSFGLGLLVCCHHLIGSEFNGQLIELAGEAERWLVVLVVHARAGIHPDIEGLVDSK